MFEVTILTAVLILRLHSMVSLLCIDTALREYHRTPLVKSGNGDDPCRQLRLTFRLLTINLIKGRLSWCTLTASKTRREANPTFRSLVTENRKCGRKVKHGFGVHLSGAGVDQYSYE